MNASSPKTEATFSWCTLASMSAQSLFMDPSERSKKRIPFSKWVQSANPVDLHDGQVSLRSLVFSLLALVEEVAAHHDRARGQGFGPDGPHQGLDMADLHHWAPECLGLIDRPSSPATDLYAVGVAFYKVVAGRYPFDAPNLGQLLLKSTTSSIGSLRTEQVAIPAFLDEMIVRLLKRDPLDRYQDPSAVAHDLRLWLDHGAASDSDELCIGTQDRRSRVAEASLVGRRPELEMHDRLFETLGRNRSRPIVFAGRMGSGKSRLVEEIARLARAKGIGVLRIQGEQGPDTQPLVSLRSFFQDLRGVCMEDWALREVLLGELESHRVSLSPWMPWLFEGDSPSKESTGPDQFAGRRLQHGLRRLLELLAQYGSRLTILVDDLHCCDPLAQGLLTEFILYLHQAPSLRLSLTAMVSSDATSCLQALNGATISALEGLSSRQITRMLQSMIGQFPADALARIADAAQGSPYMATALLRGLIESGDVLWNQGQWQIKRLGLESMQSSRQAARALVARIDALPPSAMLYFEAAAVLGQTFRLDEARRLARMDLAGGRAAQDEGLGHLLITLDSQNTQARFFHEEIQHAILERMPERQRRAMHLRAARLIGGSECSHRCFERARHLFAGGQRRRSFPFAVQAAKELQRQYAFATSLQYWRMAVDSAVEFEPTMLPGLMEAASDCHLWLGDYDQAERWLSDALVRSSAPLDRTRLLGKMGEVAFKRGQMAEAANCFAQALRQSGSAPPGSWNGMLVNLACQMSRQLAHSCWGRPKVRPKATDLLRMRWYLFSRLAHVYWFSRGPLWTLSAHLQGMNEAERFEDTPELAKSYSEHAPVCGLLRQYARAAEYSKRSLAIRLAMQDRWGQGQTLAYASVVQLLACDFAECVETANRAIKLLEQTGDAWETNMVQYQRSNALYRLGRLREAAQAARRVHQSGVAIGDVQAAGISLDVWIRSAPFQVSRDAVELHASQHRTDAQSHAQSHLALAIFRLREGRALEASQILDDAIARCHQAGHWNAYINPCLPWLATVHRILAQSTPRTHVAPFLQQVRVAYRAARRAVSLSRRYPADLPHALRELGNVQVLLGKAIPALRSFQDSIRIAQEMDCLWEEYQTLLQASPLRSAYPAFDAWFREEAQIRLDVLKVQLQDGIALAEDQNDAGESASLVDRFDTLLSDGRRVARSLEPEVIHRESVKAAQHLLRGQSVMVVQRSAEASWEVQAHIGTDAPVEWEMEQLTWCREQLNQLATSESTQVLSIASDSISQPGSWIGSPIRVRESVMAWLVVAHSTISGMFGQAEIQMLDFIATLAGAALENAEGFARLQELNKTLEQRVAERTAAAEQRAHELAASNQALRKTEEQLLGAIDAANTANEAKSRFLATMSHEIRTPLNGILGMARLAISKNRDSTLDTYLQSVQLSGDALLRLLNDLLDFSKIEAGKMTLELSPMEPARLIGEVATLMAISAWQKGIELVVSIDSNLPEWLMADSTRLRQIVLNLLGNAIKFTLNGHVELRVRAELDVWKIQVIDTGIGIPPAKQKSVFDAFAQADASTTRRFGGTGLGLSISAELARLMGGNIQLQSLEGHGSEFTLILPLMPVTPADISTTSISLPGTKILVIEPNDAAREALVRTLEAWHAQVISLDRYSPADLDRGPDLWLFDLVMVAGPESTAWLDKAAEAGALTLHCVRPDEVSNSKHQQIVKPILPEQLRREFGKILVESDKTAATGSSSDATSLHVLVAEDGPVNQVVISGLLEMLGHRASMAEDGRRAFQLLTEGEYDLCLMDLDMPEMDGLEATRASRKAGVEIPIFAMTAHHDTEYQQACLVAGMDGFLTKPIDCNALQQVLQQVASGGIVHHR